MIKIISKDELGDVRNLRRSSEPDLKIRADVEEIIRNVRAGGDRALRKYSLKFDGACPETLELPREAMEEALNKVPAELLEVIREAARRIENYHRAQIKSSYMVETEGTIVTICEEKLQ